MILVIGDEIFDEYVELKTAHRCPEGDWPVVTIYRQYSQHGGASAVVDMVVAMGVECYLLGNTAVGEDQSRKRRVSIDGKMVYRQDADVSRDFSRKVIRRIESDELTPDVVLISDYGKGAISREVVKACLRRNWTIVADPHHSVDLWTYVSCYGVTPNRRENRTNNYWLRTDTFPRCCLKLDSEGMDVRDNDEQFAHFESTAKQPVFDGCGAGDQVLATIGVMLDHGADWITACEAANRAAGIKCGRRGTTPVTKDEFEEHWPAFGR